MKDLILIIMGSAITILGIFVMIILGNGNSEKEEEKYQDELNKRKLRKQFYDKIYH